MAASPKKLLSNLRNRFDIWDFFLGNQSAQACNVQTSSPLTPFGFFVYKAQSEKHNSSSNDNNSSSDTTEGETMSNAV